MRKRRLIIGALSLLCFSGCVSTNDGFDINDLQQTRRVLLCDPVICAPLKNSSLTYVADTTTEVVSANELKSYVDDLVNNVGDYDVFMIGILTHLVFLDASEHPLGMACIALDGSMTTVFKCEYIGADRYAVTDFVDCVDTRSSSLSVKILNLLKKERPDEILEIQANLKASGVTDIEYLLKNGLIEAKRHSAKQGNSRAKQ